MLNTLILISNLSVPFIFFIIIIHGYFNNVNIYESFVEGAKECFETLYNIFPCLLAMLIAINIFEISGGMEIFINIFNPILQSLNIPGEVFPLLLLRPLSGSGSLSYVNNIIKKFGPDSFTGKMASTIQGSTETTFYIITVYFGAAKIKKYRYAILTGLLADTAGFFAAIFICKILFSV